MNALTLTTSRWLKILTALCLFNAAESAWGQAVPLNTAGSFGVLGGQSISNTGPTIVTGNLGIFPGNASSVTGFPPGIVIGTTHFGDAVAQQAQNDLTTAYNTLAGRACTTTISGDLGGRTLFPGVYCSASTMGLTGTLTLDAQGDPNAIFIFQVGSALTTASASAVRMINGGQNCNVFWQIGSSATLGTTTAFIGNLIAFSSITLTSGATTSGRVLARNGSVTIDSGMISVCQLVAAGPPSIIKAFAPSSISSGGVSTLTITLSNPEAMPSTLTAPLIDNLPAGVTIAALPNASTTCGGTGAPLATPGGSSVTLPAGRTIPANGSCTLIVNVTGTIAGSYINIIPIGALQTNTGSNLAPATATLLITQLLGPSISKAFAPSSINAGGVSTLTITLSNSQAMPSTLTAPLIDNLPAGVTIAALPNVSTTCGGTGAPLETPGGSSVTLPAGRTIPANGSCTLIVNVTGTVAGSYINIIPIGALQTNTGNNLAPATATLLITQLVVPSISKAFAPSSISAGGVSTLTITLSNPEATPSTLTAPLIDNLPGGVTIAALPNVSTTCGGTGAPLATPGGSSVTLPAGRTIPANGSCTLIVNVTGTVAGSYINIIPIGALQTNTGNNLAPATATLLITQLVVPIAVSMFSSWALFLLSAVLIGVGAITVARRI